MDRLPRNPNEGILHGMGRFIVLSFLLQAIGTILVFCLEYYIWPSQPWLGPGGIINEVAREEVYREATTTAFLQAALFELFVVWNCRSEKRSVWRMGKDAFRNKVFVVSVVLSVIITVGIVYIPVTQQLLHLYPLSLRDLGITAAVASWGLFVFPELTMNRSLWRWK
jgi:Ca2+-transporting ATPase